MHEQKQKKQVEANKKQANAAFQLMKTLRRLGLAFSPTGRYNDTTHVFNIWGFAKKYGITKDGRQESK